MPTHTAHDALILVVDDEPMVRCAIGFVLRTHGFKVIEAEHGAAALLTLQQSRPDAIVSDLNMGPVDGLELIQTLKQNPALASIPFVIVTAEIDSPRLRQTMASGASAHLCKPFSAQELLAVLLPTIQSKPGDLAQLPG